MSSSVALYVQRDFPCSLTIEYFDSSLEKTHQFATTSLTTFTLLMLPLKRGTDQIVVSVGDHQAIFVAPFEKALALRVREGRPPIKVPIPGGSYQKGDLSPL